MIARARPGHRRMLSLAATPLAATLTLAACQPAVPVMGFSNQDFQPEAIQESADQVMLKGRILTSCEDQAAALPGVEVRLLESGVEAPRATTTTGPDGSFELRTTRSAVDAGRTLLEVLGRARVVTRQDLAQGLEVLVPCAR